MSIIEACKRAWNEPNSLPKRVLCFALWVFTIMAVFDSFAMNASAETGVITVTNESEFSHNAAGTPQSPVTIDWSKFLFDVADYNGITTFNMTINNLAALVWGYESNVTSFTCVAPNSCSGTVSYSHALGKFQWNFAPGSIITTSPIELNYAVDIFADITAQPGGGYSGATANVITSTTPMCIYTSTFGRCLINTFNPASTMRYGDILNKNVNNYYNVTYPLAGNAIIEIIKNNQTIGTNVTIHSQTNNSASYFTETTYNTNNFTTMITQTDGIYINVTTATNNFNDVLINSSGIAPGPSPAPTAPYTSVNSINTTKTTYNDTESVNIFGSFYPATSTQEDCLFFGFICTNTTINTESNTGYVFIWTTGSSSPVKFTAFTPDGFHNYNLFEQLNIGTYQAQLYGFSAPGATCQGGVVYDFPLVPLGCYYPHNITSFNVVNNSGTLSIVWNTKLANSTAFYGETVSVAWQNVTADDTVSIFNNNGTLIQNYNTNLSTTRQLNVYIPLYTIGTWRATIFNGSNSSDNATAYLNVIPPDAVGMNNSYGIIMYWSLATGTVNVPNQLNWNTGIYSGAYTILLTAADPTTPNQTKSFSGAAGDTQQTTFTMNKVGSYTSQFLDENMNLQQQADIFISSAPVVVTATTPPPASQTGSTISGWLASPLFWALILIGGLMLAMSNRERRL